MKKKVHFVMLKYISWALDLKFPTRKKWPDDKFVFGQVCYQHLNFVLQLTLFMFSNELPIGSKGYCLGVYCYFPVIRLVKFV